MGVSEVLLSVGCSVQTNLIIVNTKKSVNHENK